MKFYEYGVRSSESTGFLGQFGEAPNKQWKGLMDEFSRLGAHGWENYNIIEKNNVIHFFFRREISKEESRNIYMSNADTYPLGFVDHQNLPIKDVWK